MRDVSELVDAVDLVVTRAGGVAPDAAVVQAAADARALRARHGFGGESLVLAIAGGTGSGKSSLLNAVAGEQVASVSHLRPHTDEPLAWLPDPTEPGLEALVTDMGIERRVMQTRMPGVALLDLPDLDSIAGWHRRTVEELLPRVDGVIWLFDPEKYHDRSIHDDFLRPLARYRDQFVFVVNKADRVPPRAAGRIRDHLTSILEDDGHPDAAPVVVAAAPPVGGPQGIDDFSALLRERLEVKRTVVGKVIGDAEQVIQTLAEAAGVWRGGGVGFDERWPHVRDRAACDLARGGGVAAREEVLCQIEDLVAAMALEIGEEFGDRVRRHVARQRIESGVRDAASLVPREQPARNRYGRRTAHPTVETSELAAVLERRIGLPMRSLLWERALFGATVSFAAVGARQLRARLTRG